VGEPILSTGPYDYGEEYKDARKEAIAASQAAT
jgi:cytochrome c oxidase subunit 1